MQSALKNMRIYCIFQVIIYVRVSQAFLFTEHFVKKNSNHKFARNINGLFLQVKILNLLKRVITKRHRRM